MTLKRWKCLGFLLLLFLSACSRPQNFSTSDTLLFEGSFSEGDPQFSGAIKVITWNTNYGEKLDQIIEALSEVDELKNADVLLLQELDETNVDLLAQALKYNYVYYTATIHPHHERNFGNAILSPWPLSDPQMLRLPNSAPDFKQDRIAVRAIVTIDDFELSAYSVHLEHFWMLPGRGDSQVDVLVHQVGLESGSVVVGGDFNSWSPGSIATLERLFGEIGLRRISKGIGPTIKTLSGISIIGDHIFASEFFESEAGAWQQSEISDHAAVWAILSVKETEANE